MITIHRTASLMLLCEFFFIWLVGHLLDDSITLSTVDGALIGGAVVLGGGLLGLAIALVLHALSR